MNDEHVLMHHPKLGRERRMPKRAAKHWEKVGWKVGSLPKGKAKSKNDPPEGSEQEGDA
jgi:hypothetical protein